MLGRLQGLTASRALAELAIIVVGVLAALGVDEWRQEREERALEHQYLQSLVVDLRQDITRIDVLADRNFDRLAGVTRLLQALGEDYSPVSSSPVLGNLAVEDVLKAASEMTLVEAVAQAARVFPLDTSSPTFDELRSTGRLQLIESPDVKRSIAEYYRAVDASHFPDREQEIIIWEDFHRLLADHGLAVMDIELDEAVLLNRLRAIPNLAAAVRRIRSVYAVQAIYTYPLRSQAGELIQLLERELTERW